jgi:RNA polymerase sigma-70 factor, ECF subfamily
LREPVGFLLNDVQIILDSDGVRHTVWRLTAFAAPDSLFLPACMPTPDTPKADAASKSGEKTSTRLPNGEEAQLCAEDGVPTDVSSVALDPGVLDRGMLNGGARFAGGVSAGEAGADVDAMLRVKTGDESAFAYLVQKYRRPMVGFMYRLCHNAATAEELAQEVFLRVYRSRTTYEPSAKFTTWLYRIATNLAVNHARDTRHERSAQNVYLDAPDEESGTTPDVADATPTVEQDMLRDERMAAIRTHVMALPERQRMAVLMHKYQGMDYRQIGDVLKLSESATKSLLFRAYQTLRDKLKDFV